MQPDPDRFAVIFRSQRTPGDHGYEAMAERMLDLARQQPGFLGVDSARGADGFGLTVSYWASEAAIEAWRQQADHLLAQRLGAERWYEQYSITVAKVLRTRGGPGTKGL